MRTLRNLTVGAVLIVAATATAAAAESLIETIVVTPNPARSVAVVDKVLPSSKIEVASPMPTDMPEAEVDFHLLRIDVATAPAAKRVKS